MVGLSERFALLSALCAIASVSLVPIPAQAAVLQTRREHAGEAKSVTDVQEQDNQRRLVGQWDQLNPFIRMVDASVSRFARHPRNLGVNIVADIPPLVHTSVELKKRQQVHFSANSQHGEASITRRDDHVHIHDHEHEHGHHHHHHDHHRRRSVVIPSEQGNTYVVGQAREIQRRDSTGVPGTVDIMSPSSDGPAKHLASLFLTQSNATFTLNASDTNKTDMYLVGSPSAMESGMETPVSLQVPMYDRSKTEMVLYCATYNPNPPEAEPMTVVPCLNGTAPADQSQTFLYNKETGTLRPMWFNGQEDGAGNAASADNSTLTGQDPATPTNASMTSVTSAMNVIRDDNSGGPAQNVTLMFVPSSPQVTSEDKNSTNSTSSMVVMTVTSTEIATETSTTIVTSTSVVGAETSTTATSDASPTSSPMPLDVEVAAPMQSAVSSSAAASSTGLSSSTPSATATSDANNVASAIAGDSESSSATDASSSMVTATATASGTDTGSAAAMTPVNTAPYEWRFKAGRSL